MHHKIVMATLSYIVALASSVIILYIWAIAGAYVTTTENIERIRNAFKFKKSNRTTGY